MQIVIPFACVLLFFLTYCILLLCFLPFSIENLGQAGDSFGAINSLFTGLGFAGLLTTITLQLRQISENQKQNKQSAIEVGIRNYEYNLFRLLDLYKDSINALVQSDGNNITKGLDVLRNSSEHVNRKISQDNGNQISPKALENYIANSLSEKEKQYFNDLFQKNLYHLNFSFNRQGRYTASLTSLLHYLENEGPEAMDRNVYRNIILSQMTAIEFQYIFLYCVGIKNDGGLRDLATKSGLLSKFSSIKKSTIQKIICKEFWGLEIKNIRGKNHEIPKSPFKVEKKGNKRNPDTSESPGAPT